MRIARLESRPIGLRSAAQAVLFLTAMLAAASLTIAQPARADIGETIILRCTHRESLSGFSQSAYRQALKELNADTEEYSNCSALIRRAQEAAAGGGGSAGGGGRRAGRRSLRRRPSSGRSRTRSRRPRGR